MIYTLYSYITLPVEERTHSLQYNIIIVIHNALYVCMLPRNVSIYKILYNLHVFEYATILLIFMFFIDVIRKNIV